ncbi:tyrosine-type recombinase/integrase [Microbacterium hatanonis]|uniref:Site-specific integrase n=1 Tax=Microbacterium hatanonis TaxID=404366 RepID=A0A5C8I257_9MICO|nr:site-specific integrase [Microbacterium hatanonis]TXK13092.1 site-specific integrase [Microbacterium hatanonis]
MSVEKRPNGKWRARVYSKGHSMASRTFNLKRDAEAWHNEQARLLQIGDWVDPRRADVQMTDLFKQYLEATKSVSNPKSYDLAEQHIRTHLDPRLGRRPASAVSVRLLETMYRDLLNAGLAESTVRRIRDTLSSVYTWAIRSEILRTHTVRDSRVTARRVQSTRRAISPFSRDELARTLSAQRALNPAYVLVTEFAGLTGLRWGELAALRVSSVKLDEPVRLLVVRSKSERYPEKTTKSEVGRRVPLVPRAREIALSLIEGKQPDEHLFTSSRGLPITAPNFKRDVHWAHTSQDHRFHDLRHTAATEWLRAGVELTTVSKWLGHASPTVTLNIYSHYVGDASDFAALERLARKTDE